MSKAKINQLWPIPLFEGNFLISENIKQKFYNEEFERMPNENGAFSVNKYILNSLEYEEVRNKIMSCVNAYVHSFLKVSDNVKFYLQNSWVVKHKSNDWGQPHSHGNSLLSGVYYLNTDNQSGNILLHKPGSYTNVFHQSTRLPFDEVDNINCETWNIKPNNGDILLFPSHLVHSIEKNKSNIIRYALAFNLHIEAELYSKKSNIDYLKLRNGNRYEK